MNLCIATPTMYLQCAAGFAETLVEVGRVCAARGINFYQIGVDSCDVVTARNLLVMKFLGLSDRTHLLFIDFDSKAKLRAIDRLLASEHQFSALPFCKRQINLEEFANRIRTGHSYEQALACSFTWCLDFEDGTRPVVDGWMQVRRTGFGCVLLTRELLERMGEAWFNKLTINREELSEDTSFCERARSIAKPHVLVEEPTWHCGSFHFGTRFLDDPRYFGRTENDISGDGIGDRQAVAGG